MKTADHKLLTPNRHQIAVTNGFAEAVRKSFGFWFLSLVGFWISGFGVSAADDPSAELSSFQIADGFEVNLFASESNGVVKPIQIRFDASGRLWVIGSTVYPQIEPGQKPDDKVLILEDGNRDGRADKTTVFADGLMIPTGIEVVENGCYLGHGTELLLLKDNNGDGKADERRVVLRGFGTGDNHQNINSFMWGPGGELFFCQGLHIHSHVETPWGVSSLEQAGLWRLRPRLLKLDGFYGSANEPQNPWGWVFTEWGEPIVIAGNNSSHIYPVPGMAVSHRDEAPPLIWKNGNGRKCSNGDIVGTAHFPDSWQGALIVGGYINNAVWALKIKDDGAGFALEDLAPLIKSTSRNFRPVDAKFGPDGALYIADWYNPIIGHYQASFRHPERDKTHGRIWRVTAKGRALTEPPELAGVTISQLLDYLKSPDQWTRHFAKRVLAERPTEEVVSTLRSWTTRNTSEHALKEALGVYQSHEAIAPDLLARLSSAKDAGARAYAASVIGLCAERLGNTLQLLRPLVQDSNPRVRLQALVACSYVPRKEAMELAAVAMDFSTDKFLDYAWRQAVFALKPRWLPALKEGKLNLNNSAARLSALVRADGTPDTVGAVRALAMAAKGDLREREMYLQLLTEVGGAADLAAILQTGDAEMKARLLPGLATAAQVRNVRPTGDLATALQPMTAHHYPPLVVEALKLAGVWKLETLRPALSKEAANGEISDLVRAAAIEGLASLGGEASERMVMKLADDKSPRVQTAAIVALTDLNLPEAARAAARNLARSDDDKSAATIFSVFFRKLGGGPALAEALATVPPSKTAAEAGLRVMSAGGRSDDRLASVLNEAAGLRAQNSKITASEIARFVEEVRAGGDARRGAEIFRRPQLGCLACHVVNGQGGNIGPDLSALGSAQPIDFIVGAILDPQKEIKEGFTSVSVTTKDGEEYQGYQVRETKEEVVLRDVLQNKDVRVRRATIQEKRQSGSVMPSGLVDTLTRDEFRDLVSYLSELGRTK
jgi:putative heme-binding domain-containing protein